MGIPHTVRRITTFAFAAAILAGLAAAPRAAGQQQPPADPSAVGGVIGGDAKSEAKKPYENYAVWVVDLDKAGVVARVALNDKAEFFLSALAVPGNYLLQLVDIKNNKNDVVCTEGPFKLTTQLADIRKVEIKCHRVPAGFWLLSVAAAAGVVGALLSTGAVSGAQ
jgi:hypothetical protein